MSLDQKVGRRIKDLEKKAKRASHGYQWKPAAIKDTDKDIKASEDDSKAW
jgi:hypothetical protein